MSSTSDRIQSHSETVIASLSELISRIGRSMALEMITPSRSADESDEHIRRCREQLAKLRAIRGQLEDFFAEL